MSISNEGTISERKVFWSSVAASVVASLLIIVFIQPLLSSFWSYLSSTGSDLLNWFVDRLYKNASLGNRNWVIALFSVMLLYLPFVNIMVLAFARPIIRKLIPLDDQSDKPRSILGLIMILISLTFVGIVLATIPASYIYTDLQLNASFDQRLQVLSPHLTDQQIKELKAEWAAMSSKSDYLRIKEKMELQASNSKIKLPAPLLKD